VLLRAFGAAFLDNPGVPRRGVAKSPITTPSRCHVRLSRFGSEPPSGTELAGETRAEEVHDAELTDFLRNFCTNFLGGERSPMPELV
jgi:hypothetical protein